MYEEIVDGDYVRFVRNENYWGEQPYYDEVIVKYIPDAPHGFRRSRAVRST